jgi:hypothetical protein
MLLRAIISPMATEQRWALNLMSVGFAYPARYANQMRGGGSGRKTGPPPSEWRVPTPLPV